MIKFIIGMQYRLTKRGYDHYSWVDGVKKLGRDNVFTCRENNRLHISEDLPQYWGRASSIYFVVVSTNRGGKLI